MFKSITKFNFPMYLIVLLSIVIGPSAYADRINYLADFGTVNIFYGNDGADMINIPTGTYVKTASPIAHYDNSMPTGIIWIGNNKCTNIQGRCAVKIRKGLYASYGVRHNGNDSWALISTKGELPFANNDVFLVDLITETGGASPWKGDAWAGNEPLASVQMCDSTGGTCKVDPLLITMNMYAVKSTCSVITADDMAFVWPAISPSQITNGSVQQNTAPVTMSCAGDAQPVDITITSSNGSYDATNGIVKTDKDNLGLQLNWVSNGQPVQLDKTIQFPGVSSSTEDFGIIAKPVATSTGNIDGGDFSTVVTMSIEYR